MSDSLSDDELILLAIAAEGEYLAPIGRWKPSIEHLTSLGLLRQQDEVNFVITPAGRKRAEQQEDEEARAFLKLNNLAVERKTHARDEIGPEQPHPEDRV